MIVVFRVNDQPQNMDMCFPIRFCLSDCGQSIEGKAMKMSQKILILFREIIIVRTHIPFL